MRLAQAGWVEDVRPAGHAMHVLAHQVMALVLQEGGLSRHRLRTWLEHAYPFSGVGEAGCRSWCRRCSTGRSSTRPTGVLTLGRKGEQRYGKKHFFELYAVFSAPPSLRVVHGNEEVGFIQASFLVDARPAGRRRCASGWQGGAWEVGQVDFSKGVAYVQPARGGAGAQLAGRVAGTLSTKLCQTMREVAAPPGGGGGLA